MFKPGYGTCIDCPAGTTALIVVKAGRCKAHNEAFKQAKKKPREAVQQPWKRNGPIKKRKKPTGEWAVFMEIWNERKHSCQCCGAQLGDDPEARFFSHVLSKGAYVAFRLFKLNIMLKCPTCHDEWEFGDKSQDKFKLARMIAEKLKRMYYVRNNTNNAGGCESAAPADTK